MVKRTDFRRMLYGFTHDALHKEASGQEEPVAILDWAILRLQKERSRLQLESRHNLGRVIPDLRVEVEV